MGKTAIELRLMGPVNYASLHYLDEEEEVNLDGTKSPHLFQPWAKDEQRLRSINSSGGYSLARERRIFNDCRNFQAKVFRLIRSTA